MRGHPYTWSRVSAQRASTFLLPSTAFLFRRFYIARDFFVPILVAIVLRSPLIWVPWRLVVLQ